VNHLTYRLLTALVAAGGLAACSNGSGAVPPAVTSVNPGSPSYSHLQFVAGTANIAGQIGLNTVVTLRQPNGLSAVGSSTPTITWDGAFTNAGGTGHDAGTNQISGVLPANPAGGAVAKSTFGTAWGAFGYGFSPSNSTTAGGPTTIQQPCLPLYAAALTAPNLSTGTLNCAAGAQFFGGPPAFPNVRGVGVAGQLGGFLGFTPFAGLAPAPNPATGAATFTLSVSLPTSPVIKLAPVTSTMHIFAGLGTFATPAFTSDGAGGGSIAYALPAGVTEAYLEVIDWGPDDTTPSPNCNFATAGASPYFYTIKVTPGSPDPIALGDNLAALPGLGALPAGRSTHTICTGADNTAAVTVANSLNLPITNAGTAIANGGTSGADYVQIIGIGFDYPAYEAAYPQSNGNPTPGLAGANGQADITISDESPLIDSANGLPAPAAFRRSIR
jgi:hypothetical protein